MLRGLGAGYGLRGGLREYRRGGGVELERRREGFAKVVGGVERGGRGLGFGLVHGRVAGDVDGVEDGSKHNRVDGRGSSSSLR